MDFKELIKFGLEESSEPIIKNPVLRNAMADGGTPQLVQPSVDGLRPGYSGKKRGTGAAASAYKRDFKKNPPWNKGISDPSKFTYTSSGKKIYKSTKDIIKKMDSTTVPFYSDRKQMWGVRQSRIDGKKQPLMWKKKKSDINKFIKEQSKKAESRIEEARSRGLAKKSANEKKYVQDIENWTDNWFKQNKFDDVRDIDKAINKLKKDYAKAKINKPEGVMRAAAVEGFPNIPDAGRQALTRSKIKGGFQNSYYRKKFLNNVLDNNPLLEKRVGDYFDYVVKDKSTLKAIQEGGYENLQQLKNAYDDSFKNMDDITFLLSQDDTGLYGQGKYDFLNKRFKNYNNYSKKVNQSGITYLNNIKKIEDTLGPRKLKQLLNGETSVIKFMAKQQSDLAKIFDVKQLPSELGFSLDHNIGVADISRMTKSQMENYINSYVGTTVKRNSELGLKGFSNRKAKLIKNINNGIDVKSNLAKLNKITKTAYPETLGKNPYKMVGGKVDVTKSFVFPKTQKEIFTDYFKELNKTKKGRAAIKKQHGNLNNLLVKLGCGMYAGGGRVGFKVGSGKCINRAMAKLRSGKLNASEKKIVDAMGDGLKKIGGKGGMPKKFWTTALKGEGYFALADFANNLTKGQSLDKSFSNAIKTATFGLADFKGNERDLMKYAEERGLDTEAVKQWMDYGKTYGKYEKAYEDMDRASEILASDEIVGPDDSMLQTSVIEQTPSRIKKLDEQLTEKEKQESIYSGKGSKDFNEAIEGVIAREWNKTAGTPFDRGYRKMVGMKGDEGLVWGGLGALTREGLEQAGLGEHDALKGFTPQKIMNYHPVYGYKEDIKDVIREGDSPMEDMLMFMEKYYPSSALLEEAARDKMGTYDYDPNLGYNYAGGGIAGIRRPSAIPPESGPTPYGLPSMLNRVKKV